MFSLCPPCVHLCSTTPSTSPLSHPSVLSSSFWTGPISYFIQFAAVVNSWNTILMVFHPLWMWNILTNLTVSFQVVENMIHHSVVAKWDESSQLFWSQGINRDHMAGVVRAPWYWSECILFLLNQSCIVLRTPSTPLSSISNTLDKSSMIMPCPTLMKVHAATL